MYGRGDLKPLESPCNILNGVVLISNLLPRLFGSLYKILVYIQAWIIMYRGHEMTSACQLLLFNGLYYNII